ncbi:M61 family metallopeptidase [Aquirufa sp. ROCK2-A2]
MLKNLTLLFSILSLPLWAQNEVVYSVDLTNVQNDQLSIEVLAPKFKTSNVTYYLPKIVPGTYANYDFGRYVSEFKAFDKNGKELSVKKNGLNGYTIKSANTLYKISYLVDDSWDSPEIEGEYIFEPAGSSFEENKLFALNTHCLFGYFEGFEKTKIKLEIQKPNGFYGATSLKNVASQKSKKDQFQIASYQELVDSPLMYSKPDTVQFKIANADILISVYTPNNLLTAEQVAQKIRPLLELQKNYLGGTLPVDKYAYLIILSDHLKNGSYGALEHAQSSFYYLPEGNIQTLGQTISDVSAHEFFHVLTPLNIHSEEIGNFNFNQPKMSQHLWLYEGLTEYAAHHAQLKENQDLKRFLNTIKEKWETMNVQFDNSIPFTEMSKNVLDKYKSEYSNVYQKGALLGFGLDLSLRKWSNGQYGTQNMLEDLAKIYGKNKSFKDDELFEQIEKLTGKSEIRTFFNSYIQGNKPLPLNEWLHWIGYELKAKEMKNTKRSMGFDFQGLNVNASTHRLVINSGSSIDEFGQTMGLLAKDELISINSYPLDMENFSMSVGNFFAQVKVGDIIELQIARPNKEKGFDNFTLKAPFKLIQENQINVISELVSPNESQVKLRNAWMKPSAK